MPTHVALLRGLNVGKSTRVPMDDLREVVSSLGHTEVATYVQSGNVVFTGRVTELGHRHPAACDVFAALNRLNRLGSRERSFLAPALP